MAYASDAQEEGERKPLREAIERFEAANASLLLFGGDTNYGYMDAPSDWVDALGPYAEDDRTLLVLGAHDKPDPGHRRFLPDDQTWWTQEVNGVVIVALDSSDELAPGSPQEAWLVEQLRAHEDRFVLLTLHVPWWVPPVEDRDPRGLFPHEPGFFDDLVAKYDVEVVLGAHEHYYSRTERLNATFVISGPVDAHVRPVTEGVKHSSAVALSTHTSMLLDLSPCGIRAAVLDRQGDVIDGFDVALVPEGEENMSLPEQGVACAAADPSPHPLPEEPPVPDRAGGADGFAGLDPVAAPPLALLLVVITVVALARRRL